jgi:hypothetical protein
MQACCFSINFVNRKDVKEVDNKPRHATAPYSRVFLGQMIHTVLN